jgi:hypothetical protein
VSAVVGEWSAQEAVLLGDVKVVVGQQQRQGAWVGGWGSAMNDAACGGSDGVCCLQPWGN